MNQIERKKFVADLVKVARTWKSDFIRKQFARSWENDKEIQLLYSGSGLAVLTRMRAYYIAQREAYCIVLHERDEL